MVFGKVEPGTNFNNLFKSMVGPTRDLNQPGIKKFLEALRRLGVRSNELSGNELQLKYEPHVPRGSYAYENLVMRMSNLVMRTKTQTTLFRATHLIQAFFNFVFILLQFTLLYFD